MSRSEKAIFWIVFALLFGVLAWWKCLTWVEGWGDNVFTVDLSETIAQTHMNPIDTPKYGSIGIPCFDVECRIVDLETGKERELASLIPRLRPHRRSQAPLRATCRREAFRAPQ